MKKLLKYIYKNIPFKKEFFITLKKIWIPPESIYKHLFFKGVIKVRINNTSSFKMKHYGFELENEIFWAGLKGGWEKVSNGLWIELCKNSEVIFDIGANTGLYSFIAKAVNRNSHVFVFEPVKRVFDKLLENNMLNNYDIKCLPLAVSDSNGKAVIYDLPEEHIYSVTVNKNLNPPGTTVIETEIETVTLDSVVEKYGIHKIDLIKIDVETHEPEVLKGFSKYLAKFKPAMLIEILNDDVGKRVQEIISGLGYLYFNIDEKKGIRQTENITKSDFYNYLLCNEQTAKSLHLT